MTSSNFHLFLSPLGAEGVPERPTGAHFPDWVRTAWERLGGNQHKSDSEAEMMPSTKNFNTILREPEKRGSGGMEDWKWGGEANGALWLGHLCEKEWERSCQRLSSNRSVSGLCIPWGFWVKSYLEVKSSPDHFALGSVVLAVCGGVGAGTDAGEISFLTLQPPRCLHLRWGIKELWSYSTHDLAQTA